MRNKPLHEKFKDIFVKNKNSERGVAAIEFAVIAPVMILMLFGSMEITNAVCVSRKVTLASSTIADLVTQASTLDCSTLTNESKITREVFRPYNSSGDSAYIKLASVALVDGVPKVEWSKKVASDGTCADEPSLPVGTEINIPGTDSSGNAVNLLVPMLSTNTAIIMGDVTLSYQSLGTSFLPFPITMHDRFYLRPRKSDKVCFDGITTDGC